MLAWAVAGWALFALPGLFLSGTWWPWLLPDLVPPLAFLAVPLVLLALCAAVGDRARRRWLAGALVVL
ncbi:endonuclease, partial [Streptomyces sp. SID2131]|nr:endonuclease [Streptomyces sp. SID2131]